MAEHAPGTPDPDDGSRGPPASWAQRVLVALVQAYRYALSPWLGSSCRFEPTCSAYAVQALNRHGAAAGSYLAAHRIARCHPWCPGGRDDVPAVAPRWFRCFAPHPTRAVGGSPSTSTSEPNP